MDSALMCKIYVILRHDPENKSLSFPIQAIDHLDPSRTLKVTRSEPLDSHDMRGAAGGAR
jgi:hypothetical protein